MAVLRQVFSRILAGICLLTVFVSSASQAQFFRTPPAEVPEVVVMPRPSEAQLEQAEASRKAMLASLSAEERAVFEEFPYLLQITPRPEVNPTIVPNLLEFFEEKHENNKQVAAAGDIDVLFMGDSITDFWRNEEGAFAGRPIQEEYFGDLNIANFGIAGDTTQGVLYRLENGEGEGFSPQAVMLMIGTNNIGRNIPGEVAEGVGAVVLSLQQHFPEAKILLLGIFPRSTPDSEARQAVNEINGIIQRLHDGETVFYKDIGDVFLDENGNIPESVMSDGLHPSTEGYRLWAEAVEEKLRSLL